MPIFLCIGVLTYFFSVYMFIPIFFYYITDVGGGHIEYGVIIATSALITSLLQSYIGYLSDRKGVLKIVALGCFLSAVSLFSVAIAASAWLLIVLYVCLQFGIGAIAPALYSVVSRVKLKGGKNFIPYYRSIQGIGIILGPFVGGVISDISLKANVITASFLIGIAFICFYHYFKRLPHMELSNTEEAEKNEKEEKSSFFIALRKVLTNQVFLSACFLFLFIELAYDCIIFNVPMVGKSMQTETTLIGMATSAYFLTFTLFQVPINNLLRRIKVKAALIIMGA
ncbi:MAG TPA: MFS transporter, partial [Anaerovoracaceae bacterium]|nr:MFS transporter [Anaerovoracaceae bacterium]